MRVFPSIIRAILRSQREYQKKIKTSKYNLSDGEEDELAMNDGQVDDFEEELDHGSDDDNMEQADDGNRSAKWIQLNNPNAQKSVGGNSDEQEENRQKSKKEVMKEVMLKSKFYTGNMGSITCDLPSLEFLSTVSCSWNPAYYVGSAGTKTKGEGRK